MDKCPDDAKSKLETTTVIYWEKISSMLHLYSIHCMSEYISDNKNLRKRILHLKESTNSMLVCQNTQQTPTHHLTKTLNYLPCVWDLNRNRSAVLEKVHSMNIKTYFNFTAEENGLTFQTPAAKTLHKSDMDLTMRGRLQAVKKNQKTLFQPVTLSLLEKSPLSRMTGT